MNRFFGMVIAALLVLGLAGQGHAGFSDGNLIEVIYDTSTHEEAAYVLGQFTNSAGSNYINFATLTTTPTATPLNPTISLSAVGDSGGSWSNVTVAYLAMTRSSNSVYIGGTSQLSTTGNQYTAYTGALSSMYTAYGGSGATSKTGESTAASGSYYAKMDSGGTGVGNMAGYTATTPATEANLGSGSVAFQLYSWTGASASGPGAAVATLNAVYNPTTQNFTTTIASPAAAVPVPPSVLLLAPGLFGLVGLRRRWVH